MTDRLIELAIEALESRKATIEAEIAALREELRLAGRRGRVRASNNPRMSAAARKDLSERMKARWAKWRAERAKKAAQKPARRAKTKPKQAEEKKS